MIRNTAYDTTIGSSFQTLDLKKAIIESIVRDRLDNETLTTMVADDLSPIYITGRHESESNIPIFPHPYLIRDGEVPTRKNMNFLCIDVRPFITLTKEDESFKIRNTSEYTLLQTKLLLNMLWLSETPLSIKQTYNYAAVIYSTLLADTIGQRFNLDAKDKAGIAILSYLFYHMLFVDVEDVTDNTSEVVQAINALGYQASLVYEFINDLPHMENISDLCEQIKQRLQNVRLKDLNPGTLIAAIGSTWYSYNAKETLAVALEHPPTWIAVVYAAANDRTYKNSTLAKIVQKTNKQSSRENFVKGVQHMLEEHTVRDPIHSLKTFH